MKTFYLLTLMVFLFACSQHEDVKPQTPITDAAAKKSAPDKDIKKSLFYKNVGEVILLGSLVGSQEISLVVQGIVEHTKDGYITFSAITSDGVKHLINQTTFKVDKTWDTFAVFDIGFGAYVSHPTMGNVVIFMESYLNSNFQVSETQAINHPELVVQQPIYMTTTDGTIKINMAPNQLSFYYSNSTADPSYLMWEYSGFVEATLKETFIINRSPVPSNMLIGYMLGAFAVIEQNGSYKLINIYRDNLYLYMGGYYVVKDNFAYHPE